MNLKDVLQVLKTYPTVDIETKDKLIRRNISTSELSEALLRSYVSIYSIITIIPKKMTGNAPMKVPDEAITISHKDLEGENGLSGVETGLSVSSRSSSPESELYKIMYENAKEEAREYKRKYEDALNDKHKAEIELAGSKGSGLGEIAQGLAGFAPMLLGAGTGTGSPAPLGEAQPQAHVAKKADVRLQAIVKHYSTLNEEEKDAVYNLLSKVFGDLGKINEIVSLLDW